MMMNPLEKNIYLGSMLNINTKTNISTLLNINGKGETLT